MTGPWPVNIGDQPSPSLLSFRVFRVFRGSIFEVSLSD